jgi:4-hydroxy-4-methyl-2-oxoglutarate aldolase
MKPAVYSKIRRPDPEVMKLLGKLGTATVHEAQGRVGLMKPYMRPIYASAKIGGPAVTVSCTPGDNLMIHAAVEVCQAGDVLVVTTTADSTDGMFGELLASSLRARGVAGLIIDAGVRDVADLTTMDFPVWSRAVSAQGTVKATAGWVNIPVVCAGALVNPGDVIVGDVDGVVVVPYEDAAEVAKASDQRCIKEENNRQRLKAGELGLDMYGLRQKLVDLGVQFLGDAPTTPR